MLTMSMLAYYNHVKMLQQQVHTCLDIPTTNGDLRNSREPMINMKKIV